MARTDKTISMYSGETKIIENTILDSDNDNIPLNLTGFDIKFIIHDKGIVKVIKTIQNNGIQVTSASEGKCRINLLPSDTHTLSGQYHFEVRVTSGNQSSVVSLGRISITKSYS